MHNLHKLFHLQPNTKQTSWVISPIKSHRDRNIFISQSVIHIR